MGIGLSLATTRPKFGPIMFATELDKKLPRLKELGYECVDLFIKAADEPGIAALVSALGRNGLRVSILAAVAMFADYGLYLSAAEESVRSRMIAAMEKQIRLAAELGAKVPIGLVRGAGDDEDCLSYLARSLEKLYRISTPLGVPLILEPVNRYETRMLNSVQQTMDFLAAYDLPEFDLLLDVFHMNIEEADIPASIKAARGRTGHVHLADSNRRVPGKGHLDWTGIMAAFQEIDYQGDYAFEAIPGEDAWKDAEEGIHFLSSMLAKGIVKRGAAV